MARQKILVVDDDPEMRMALRIRLEANRYQVFTADDEVSAIVQAKRIMPDLMLLDLDLRAGGDGFSVLERLKADYLLQSIPVFILSGRDQVINRRRAYEGGVTVFLQKPVKNSELLRRVRHVLEADLIYD